MKLNRNTDTATRRAAESKNQKRLKLQQHIANNIMPEFCKNHPCPGPFNCGREVFKDCISYNDLAGTLNTLEVFTLSGSKGNWKAEMVKNLFRDL